jgi:hypothetical protein
MCKRQRRANCSRAELSQRAVKNEQVGARGRRERRRGELSTAGRSLGDEKSRMARCAWTLFVQLKAQLNIQNAYPPLLLGQLGPLDPLRPLLRLRLLSPLAALSELMLLLRLFRPLLLAPAPESIGSVAKEVLEVGELLLKTGRRRAMRRGAEGEKDREKSSSLACDAKKRSVECSTSVVQHHSPCSSARRTSSDFLSELRR